MAGNLCAAGWGREQDARAVGSENVKDRVQGRGLAKPGPPVITASRPPGDAVSVVLAGRMPRLARSRSSLARAGLCLAVKVRLIEAGRLLRAPRYCDAGQAAFHLIEQTIEGI